jgi:peptide/nickel transport system permease protein
VSRGFARHVVSRLASGVFVLWGAATLCFLVLSLRGDTVSAILGAGPPPTPELRARIVAEYGLDDPLWTRYLHWLRSLLSGDLGWSYQRDEPVTHLLASQVGPTLQLAVTAAVLGAGIAVLVTAFLTGRGRAADTVLTGLSVLSVSVPTFWVGALLLGVFSFALPLFPAIGDTGPAGLVLPSLTLAFPIAGALTQVMAQEVRTAESMPFALTVRARGATDRRLRLNHTLRHSLLPALTLTGWILGMLIGGAVLIENVFARPGLGRVLVAAAAGRDLPVVTAVVLLSATAFVAINLVVDLVLPVVDPRLRAEADR